MSLCPCAAAAKKNTLHTLKPATSSLGATDGGALLETMRRGPMDNYMIGTGGTKSFAGSATGATEGAPYVQLLARGPMDSYLIGTSANRHSAIFNNYLYTAGAEFEQYNLHKLRVYNNA